MAARERRDDDGRKDPAREEKPKREPGQDPSRERDDGGYDDDRPGTQRERDELS